MGSISKKFKKNNINIHLSMKFVCPKCNDFKILSREKIQSINPEEFKNNEIFICKNCNIRMIPTEIIANY